MYPISAPSTGNQYSMLLVISLVFEVFNFSPTSSSLIVMLPSSAAEEDNSTMSSAKQKFVNPLLHDEHTLRTPARDLFKGDEEFR